MHLKTLTTTIALIPFLWTATPLAADSVNFSSRADEYLSKLTQEEKFSGSVLVATNGNIVFAKGYGQANRQHGIANTTNTEYKDWSYCYGWLHGRVGDSDRVGYGHGGRISGFVSQVTRFSREHVYVVVLCNIDWINPSDVANKLSVLLFDTAR